MQLTKMESSLTIPYLEPIHSSGYELGRTAVHEAGHWLGLKHIWGDADCGDDFVDDTPKQRSYNIGCPSGSRITCNNGPTGDMYTNYMDYTNDACINLFTEGQKDKNESIVCTGWTSLFHFIFLRIKCTIDQ